MHMLTRLLLIVSVCGLGACAGMEVRPDAQISFERGQALFNQGRYEEAIPNFMRATQLDPNLGRGYLYLGRSYLNLGRWQKAIPPLRAALRLAPDETRQEVVQVLIDALMGPPRTNCSSRIRKPRSLFSRRSSNSNPNRCKRCSNWWAPCWPSAVSCCRRAKPMQPLAPI